MNTYGPTNCYMNVHRRFIGNSQKMDSVQMSFNRKLLSSRWQSCPMERPLAPVPAKMAPQGILMGETKPPNWHTVWSHLCIILETGNTLVVVRVWGGWGEEGRKEGVVIKGQRVVRDTFGTFTVGLETYPDTCKSCIELNTHRGIMSEGKTWKSWVRWVGRMTAVLHHGFGKCYRRRKVSKVWGIIS